MKIAKARLRQIIKEEIGKTTTGDYLAQVRLDKGSSGVASGVSDEERTTLLNLQKKLAAVAKIGNITTGPVLALAQKLENLLDKILEKHQAKK